MTPACRGRSEMAPTWTPASRCRNVHSLRRSAAIAGARMTDDLLTEIAAMGQHMPTRRARARIRLEAMDDTNITEARLPIGRRVAEATTRRKPASARHRPKPKQRQMRRIRVHCRQKSDQTTQIRLLFHCCLPNGIMHRGSYYKRLQTRSNAFFRQFFNWRCRFDLRRCPRNVRTKG